MNATPETTMLNRILFGAEPDYDGDGACPDCGCGVGQLHKAGCDAEICATCGVQLLSCECEGTYPPDAKEGRFPLSESRTGNRLREIAAALTLLAGQAGPGQAFVLTKAAKELRDILAADVDVVEAYLGA